MTRPSSPMRSSRQPPIRSRSCATPPARRPDASAPCAASFPRGSSTGRFGSSTACPPEASTLTQPPQRRTVMDTTSNDPVVRSYAKAPARTITADGVTYAYRELGPKGRIPVIFFVHLAATLDNWDPRIIDPIAKEHHVIAFDNRGVGASTGQVPNSVEAMADDAYTFIRALGLDKVDIFSFSLGGFIAQALVVKHPELVRKLVLTGTGPAGGKDIDKVAGTTYYDILRATLTRSDPKEFLFFNRNATGKPAARAFVNRLKERTIDRDAPITLWMRTDRPRQQGMDYWKGPHSKIISATPGIEEYRQIHLAENNPGLWPAIDGVETVIPAERRIDGVAEVTFTSVLSPLRGR